MSELDWEELFESGNNIKDAQVVITSTTTLAGFHLQGGRGGGQEGVLSHK